MSQSASTDQISFLLAGYVLGTLDDAEAEIFAQIVIEDPALIEKIDQMQQALEEAYDMPEMAPPPQLKEKVLAAVSPLEPAALQPAALQPAQSKLAETASVTSQPVKPILAFQQRSFRQFKAAVIALLAALGLSAFFNYMMWRSLNRQIAIAPAPSSQAPASDPLTYTLTRTDLAGSGTAEVLVNPNTLTAELETSQLPAIATGEVYVLWTVLAPEAPFTTDEKGAILTTTFQVDEQGNARKTLEVPSVFQQPELVAALGITVESAEAPQAHAGAPVLLSPI